MSYTIVLQDWLRVAGGASVVTNQPESEMPDISMFQDITFYTEVSDVTGALLEIQSAPLKEEAYFKNLRTFAPSVGLDVNKVKWDTATNPPARWLRWRALAAAGGSWNITFRITASLNPGGSILPQMNGMGPMSARALNGMAMARTRAGLLR